MKLRCYTPEDVILFMLFMYSGMTLCFFITESTQFFKELHLGVDSTIPLEHHVHSASDFCTDIGAEKVLIGYLFPVML